MADVSDKMIGLFIAAILTAVLIPVALQQLVAGIQCNANATLAAQYGGCNYTGTDTIASSTTFALFGIISIAVIVAIVILFFKMV